MGKQFSRYSLIREFELLYGRTLSVGLSVRQQDNARTDRDTRDLFAALYI